MKVKDLIDKLLDCDPELEVLVYGNESGYDKLRKVRPPAVYVELAHKACWMGAYEEASDESEKSFRGIVLC
jgi:hypothetical protein